MRRVPTGPEDTDRLPRGDGHSTFTPWPGPPRVTLAVRGECCRVPRPWCPPTFLLRVETGARRDLGRTETSTKRGDPEREEFGDRRWVRDDWCSEGGASYPFSLRQDRG